MPGFYHQKFKESRELMQGAKVALVLFFVLLIGAILFYKERMLFIDGPHVLFRVINDGRFHIEEHRYGSFITQMIPLLGSKLHIPFRLLVILYSASFCLFYLTVALLLVYKFREYGLAILFGLYLTLFVSDTFFWPNNEVHQGMGWLFLAFALTFALARRGRPLIVMIPVFLAFFFLAIWTHPLVMLVAVYLWFFFWLSKSQWPFSKTNSILFSILLLSLAGIKFYQGMHHGYDSTKIEEVTGFSLQKFKTIFSSPQLHYFVKGCLTRYLLFVLLFFAGLVMLLSDKKYWLATWVFACTLGYIALLSITFWGADANRFYIESEYMPLSIIACAPFVYYVLPKLKARFVVLTLILIFGTRLFYIYHAAPVFEKRVALLNNMDTKMKEKGYTKVILPANLAVDSTLIMSWGAPVESIVLSKLNGASPQRTFIFLDQNRESIANAMGKDTMLGCWEKRPIPLLNTNYFTLDTAGTYKVMSYVDLMK